MLNVHQISKRWQFHWAFQAVKNVVPITGQLRALKRKIGWCPLVIGEASVYDGGFDHISALRETGFSLDGKEILELGTGWFPVIPLMLRLAGAGRIYLTDVERLMDQSTVLVAADFLLNKKKDLAQRLGVDVARIEQLLAAPRNLSFDDLLRWFQFAYICPYDAKDVRWVDCIVSHTVLEHVPEQILRKFFRDSKRSLRPGGVHSHGIDHTDHRANVDPRLSRIDFLRYSDLTWGLISNTPQICTNRLRNSDYISMLRDTGYQIVWERKFVINQAVHEANDMKLSGRFRDKHIDDLATGWSHLVAAPS
jgi:SAM-dependent methyltransferase